MTIPVSKNYSDRMLTDAYQEGYVAGQKSMRMSPECPINRTQIAILGFGCCTSFVVLGAIFSIGKACMSM